MNGAQIVFRILRHRNLPNSWLAARTGIDQATLSRVENGHRGFNKTQQFAIAAILELPMDVLFPPSSEVEQAETVAV